MTDRRYCMTIHEDSYGHCTGVVLTDYAPSRCGIPYETHHSPEDAIMLLRRAGQHTDAAEVAASLGIAARGTTPAEHMAESRRNQSL